MISVIIPAYNEKYLDKTIESIHNNFVTDYEIIVIKDKLIREAINEGVNVSEGEYILKVDAHCGFAHSFDKTLLDNIQPHEVMIARRYTLDITSWLPLPRPVDYYYLSCPWTHPHGTMMSQSCPWITKTEQEMNNKPIDDLMCFQGSMWMMSRKHWEWLEGLEIGKEVYAEHHEISMKTWLGDGKVTINKNTWYAHPSVSVRGYHMSMRQVYKDHNHSALYWTTNSWAGQIHDYAWLIDKFYPLPTKDKRHKTEKYWWPENWKELYYDRTL